MNAANEGSRDQGDAPAGPWRILCIDDDPDILSVLRMSLRSKHEIVTAIDGLEALRIIGICEPDFVICDVRMPRMDGYATVTEIRKHPDYENIPVFFLTAEKGRDAARRGFQAGCNLYLTKPFDPIRLLENIDYFTRKSGHTIRPKTRTVEEVESLRESLPAEPVHAVPVRPPEPAPQPPPQKPPAPPPQAAPEPPPVIAATVGAPSDDELQAEHETFLADRKRREQEHWKQRYAEIQAFIDQHMKK